MAKQPPPPAGLNYIADIRILLKFIILVTALGSVLVPLIITLFFFSTPQSRRKPIFILNVIACCSGLCEAAINIAQLTRQMLYPLQPPIKLSASVIGFTVFSSIFTESLLLFRILAFYPLSLTSIGRLLLVTTVPILVKCARAILAALYMYQFIHMDGLLATQLSWVQNPYLASAWGVKMIDNIYTSVFLLFKIYQFRRRRGDVFVIRSKSLLGHLKSLFILSLGNFVFPIILNIIAVLLVAVHPTSLYTDSSCILLTGNYISIIGVVFATIWTRRQYWSGRPDQPQATIEFQLQDSDTQAHSIFDPEAARKPTLVHFGSESDETTADTRKKTDGRRTSMDRKQSNNTVSDLTDSSHDSTNNVYTSP